MHSAQTPLPKHVDVLIVGMGPVGATAANLLGRYGISTLIIDKASELFTAPRAIALDNEALRILQMAGLEDGAFSTQAIAKVQMHSPLFGAYARANTAGHIDGHPRLVTFYQPELESVLRERLSRYPSVQCALATELLDFNEDQYGITATLRQADGQPIPVSAQFMIGSDGASSAVRRIAGLEFAGRSFTQDWLVVDALNVPEPIDHVEFICDPQRPTPHMPAPGGRQRWEFMLKPGETRAQMERPETIHALLAPWCRADQITIERTAVYRFHARIVNRFSKGRVFLAGDAAHITPPFVGQGLVAGLRDVANLSWKLAWVLRTRAPLALLDSYDSERRPHARKIIRMALLMGALIMPRNRLAALGVHGLMALSQRIPVVRDFFMDLKIKPSQHYKKGLFKAGKGGARLVRGGPFPQGLVRSTANSACIPSDEVLGQKLTLVGFGCDPAAQLAPALASSWAGMGAHIICLRHRGQPAQSAPSWEDMTDSLIPGVAPVGWIAVVRPDRTVLHDGPLAQLDSIVQQALVLLGCDAAQHTQPSYAFGTGQQPGPQV